MKRQFVRTGRGMRSRRCAFLALLGVVLQSAAGCTQSKPAGRPAVVGSPATSQPTAAKPLFGLARPAPKTGPKPAPSVPSPPSPITGGAPGSATLQDNYVILVYVNFEILRMRVPKGTFSESGKIWNHLDEEAIPAESAALLQRNGLRAGRGTPDSWPPIKALLEQEKSVETSRTNTTVGSGMPLSVNVDQHRYRDQTLFLFRRDGSLGGASFPLSTNYLRIDYNLPPADPSAVILEICPEFREQQTLGPLSMKDGTLEQPVQEPTRVLREMGFRMEIKADQFCAVGPSAAAHQGHLAGSLLLCEEIEGRQYESMYFITPHVYRTDRPQAR